MPALFTRTSIRPKSARARSTIAARSLREVTSVEATLARRPSPCTSAAVRSAPARSSSATTISAPSRASSRAVARPMPRPAPVTIATWSLSSIVGPLARGQRGERLHEAPGVAEDVAIEASLGAALLHLDARDDRAVLAERQVVRASELVLGAHLQRLLDAGAPRDRRLAEVRDHDLTPQALGEAAGGEGAAQRHSSGVREAGVDRGWPERGARGVIPAFLPSARWAGRWRRGARVCSRA